MSSTNLLYYLFSQIHFLPPSQMNWMLDHFLIKLILWTFSIWLSFPFLYKKRSWVNGWAYELSELVQLSWTSFILLCTFLSSLLSSGNLPQTPPEERQNNPELKECQEPQKGSEDFHSQNCHWQHPQEGDCNPDSCALLRTLYHVSTQRWWARSQDTSEVWKEGNDKWLALDTSEKYILDEFFIVGL